MLTFTPLRNGLTGGSSAAFQYKGVGAGVGDSVQSCVRQDTGRCGARGMVTPQHEGTKVLGRKDVSQLPTSILLEFSRLRAVASPPLPSTHTLLPPLDGPGRGRGGAPGPRVAAPPDGVFGVSAGATGSEKPHTKPAGPAPSARPATEAAVRTTCVTEVGSDFEAAPSGCPLCLWVKRENGTLKSRRPLPLLVQPCVVGRSPPPVPGFSPPAPWGHGAALACPLRRPLPWPHAELGAGRTRVLLSLALTA